ncbi:MAG: glucose-1-phosphate adenylyltransferase [Desulfobulbus propionicus]|nr:MAG: glucose-1-phosphate adenylyltransferase [Desulfobulbus propionicus]
MFKPTTLALILAGGRVDELGVLTHYRPKSAVPFGGFARVIDFALSNLLKSGIEQISILSQYRSYSLINHIGTGAAWDMIGRNRGISILPPFKDYDNPHWYRGSADAVYQNVDHIEYHAPEEILILSGDHVYSMDYQKMLLYHNRNNADLTAAFIQVPKTSASRFGIAEIEDKDEEGGRLLSYEEKPERPRDTWASLTVLCFHPKVLYEVLAANQRAATGSYEFGRDIIPMMMRNNYRVFGYKFRGYWGYTRTVEEYWQTSMDLLGKNPKIDMEAWGLRTNLLHRTIGDCQPLQVGPQGVLENSMAYNGCTVNGSVINSILFPGVRVEQGAEVRDSVIFFNNTLQEGARLNRVVSDVNTTFGRNVQVGRLQQGQPGKVTVVGWKNSIPENLTIGSGCTISPQVASHLWPDKFLADGEVL